MTTVARALGEATTMMPHRPPHDLGALEALMAEGWRIEAPVLARLSWAQRRNGDLAYHFILTRDGRRSLVVICDSPEVHRFLANNAIPVL